MKVAADRQAIKKRLDQYLWEDASEPNVRLRRVLRYEFFKFDRVAIVGGMVRDFARAGKDCFNSDVDLVVDGAADEVQAFADTHGAKRNTFGGYSFISGGWKLDFWSVQSTWASKAGHVPVNTLEDVTRCTFFDWDAILYDLKERKVVCSDAYLDRLRSRRIDISLLPNPSVSGSLYRAVRRILLWDLEPGPLLSSFIDRHLDDQGYRDLLMEEVRRDRDGFLSSFEHAGRLRYCISSAEARRGAALFHGLSVDSGRATH